MEREKVKRIVSLKESVKIVHRYAERTCLMCVNRQRCLELTLKYAFILVIFIHVDSF
jgi:hypothetical protein